MRYNRLWGLVGATFAVGVGLTATVARSPDGATGASPLVVAFLLATFAATEIFVVHLEMKREAHSISLSEIPMAVGLFFVAPIWFIFVRVVGSTAGLVFHRKQRGVKLAFNVSNFILEGAVAVTVFGLIRPAAGDFGPRAWFATIVALVTVNLMTATTVTVAIGFSQGKFKGATLRRIIGVGLLAGLVNAVMGLVTAESLHNSSESGWMLAFPAAVLFLGYRGYASLAQRHTRLKRLYEYVRAIRRSPELDGSISEMLQHAREMLSAETAELWLRADGRERRFSLRGDGPMQVSMKWPDGPWTNDPERTIFVTRTTKDEAERALLRTLQTSDLIVVPVRDEQDVMGMLTVSGRLGDVATFGEDDLHLLESLANQASTSLTNGRLIERLREAVATNEHLAHHDPLTGLPNRVLFDLLVREALATPEHRPAVMLMDLDRFKEINDTLGHATGDQLLRELGARLAETLPYVTISRLGGDEFAILSPRAGADDAAIDTAHDALAALKKPFDVGELSLQVEASIGIALAPEHGDDPDMLLRRADVAMYAAKAAGSGVVVYARELDRNTPRRLALVSELRMALERGELALHYQPKVALQSGNVTGVEALLRWRHPQHGPQQPDEFIPVAEQTGLIHPLTRWVIRRALEQCKDWERDGHTLGVAVNLSARNLGDATLADDIETTMREVGMPASRLTLEITETAIMSDMARAQSSLARLSNLGVRLSIDDFGAGYTSLLSLKRLPVNEMKIDKAFITPILESEEDASIAAYVIGLGNALGLTVVAEGVENLAACPQLNRMGTDVVQGFGISRPMPASLLTAWLQSREQSPADPRSLRAV